MLTELSNPYLIRWRHLRTPLLVSAHRLDWRGGDLGEPKERHTILDSR